MRKPTVSIKCVADNYTEPGERIIEFSGQKEGQGGLISFRYDDKGHMVVYIYRCDKDVHVIVGERV